MPKMERIREVVTGPLDPEYFRRKAEAGWELAAVEWQRRAEGEERQPAGVCGDVPYGCRVAYGGLHLEENPAELEALTLMLALIVQDCSFARIAEALNQKGFHTRDGLAWTMVRVYNLLPRLIEVGPRVFSSESWVDRRKQFSHAG